MSPALRFRSFRAVLCLSLLAGCARVRNAQAFLDIEDRGPVLRAGGFALRVTNVGIIGNAFLDKGLSFDPSFEIHPGSGAEALNHAELWVGAVNARGETRVSGGPELEWRPSLDPADRVRVVNFGTPGTQRGVDDDGDGRIDEEQLNGIDDDGDGEIDEDLGLFAQQTMTAEYSDYRPESVVSPYEGNENHVPLGLAVHQEAYAWSAPGYEGIAGLSFHITNRGNETLRQVRIGLLADLDSRDRNDRAGHLNDRIRQVSFTRGVFEGIDSVTVGGVYSCGTPAPCPPVPPCITTLSQTLPVLEDDVDPRLPHVAVVPLHHTTDPLAYITPVADLARAPATESFRSAVFANGKIPGQGGPPAVDKDRYEALAGRYPNAVTTTPDDYVVLVSCGPFATLAPGQSLDFDVALVATLDPDSIGPLMANAAVLEHGRMVNLIPDSTSSRWPQDYNYGISGINGHEVCIQAPPGVALYWDPDCSSKLPGDPPPPPRPILYPADRCLWTDADCKVCTGILGLDTRQYWADPGELPVPPDIKLIPGDHEMTLEWNNRGEILNAAGLSGLQGLRFAGYRVYRLSDWRHRTSLLPPDADWALVGAYGFTTRNSEAALAAITDSTLDYERILYERKLYPIGRYVVRDSNVLNGFDYGYVVTTVLERDIDEGQGLFRTERLESPFTPAFQELVQPRSNARDTRSVWVVPNPFRAREAWQRPEVLGDPLTRHLDFMGLPRARCTIKIWTVAGDFVAMIDHDGTNGDGEAAWNLVSRNGQEVESGIYLFTVDSSLGHQVGRFVVIR